MLTRTKAAVVAGALMIALPAGAALADTGSSDDAALTTVTCDGTQQQLRQGNGDGAGECLAVGDQAKTMLQKRIRVMDGECDGEGPHAGTGPGSQQANGAGSGAGGFGPGDGTRFMNGARQGSAR